MNKINHLHFQHPPQETPKAAAKLNERLASVESKHVDEISQFKQMFLTANNVEIKNKFTQILSNLDKIKDDENAIKFTTKKAQAEEIIKTKLGDTLREFFMQMNQQPSFMNHSEVEDFH